MMPKFLADWNHWWIDWWYAHPTLWMIVAVVAIALWIGATVVQHRLRRRR